MPTPGCARISGRAARARALDAAGRRGPGLDGRARVRAWSGRGATRPRARSGDPWTGSELAGERSVRSGSEARRSTSMWPSRAARRGAPRSTAPVAAPPEPLIEALLALEQGRAATNALGAAAATCATRTPDEVWRAATAMLAERFTTGPPTSVGVRGNATTARCALGRRRGRGGARGDRRSRGDRARARTSALTRGQRDGP